MSDVTYDIIEELVTLSYDGNGWSKELNVVSWNYAPQKFDLRYWAPNHAQPGKGITLSRDEALEVVEMLVPKLGLKLVDGSEVNEGSEQASLAQQAINEIPKLIYKLSNITQIEHEYSSTMFSCRETVKDMLELVEDVNAEQSVMSMHSP